MLVEHCDLCKSELPLEQTRSWGEIVPCDYMLAETMKPVIVRVSVRRSSQDAMPMTLCRTCRKIILSQVKL